MTHSCIILDKQYVLFLLHSDSQEKMEKKTGFFKDWILEEEKIANDSNDMEENIKLEMKIDDDIKKSQRIILLQQSKGINKAYDAFIESIKQQAAMEDK